MVVFICTSAVWDTEMLINEIVSLHQAGKPVDAVQMELIRRQQWYTLSGISGILSEKATIASVLSGIMLISYQRWLRYLCSCISRVSDTADACSCLNTSTRGKLNNLNLRVQMGSIHEKKKKQCRKSLATIHLAAYSYGHQLSTSITS